MERKIGDIFEYNGEWYQCVEGTGCYQCDFNFNEDTCTAEDPHCTCRSDHKNVVYKKLEKVGEPFTIYIHVSNKSIMMQEYKMYDNNINSVDGIIKYVTDYKHKRVAIEIKQNQEDMKEKKNAELTSLETTGKNLKPFDLEAARNGKPVCTRDGRRARILAFDLKNDEYPIVAAVENDSSETLFSYTTNGEIADGIESDNDLMMLSEKKEGWVNVAKEPLGDDEVVLGYIFNSYEDAVRSGKANERYVATVRIEWEG